MRATYLAVGGADRERVITETWELLLDRRRRGEALKAEILEDACKRICPMWEDDVVSLSAYLTARAYVVIQDSLETVAATATNTCFIKVDDLDEVLSAHAILKEIDELGRAIAIQQE